MNTKKTLKITQHRINQMIATRLGLDMEIVEDIMQVEVKIIHDNLKRGHTIEIPELLSIIPKHRKGYSFKSGLDGKKYKVLDKYSIEVEMMESMQDIINQQSKFIAYTKKKS